MVGSRFATAQAACIGLSSAYLSNKRYVFALLPLVDVRAEPELGAARMFQVRQQVALERLESTGTGWIKVRHQDGNVGFVRITEVWGG